MTNHTHDQKGGRPTGGRLFCAAAVVPFALVCWVFFQFFYPYHFYYQEQNQLFLWSADYLCAYFDAPGGLARLAGDCLTQLYYYQYAGALILTLAIAAIGLLLCKAMRGFRAGRVVAAATGLLAMALVAVSHFSLSYKLFSTVSVMGWAAVLWLVSLARGWRLRVAAAACLLPAAWWLLGLPQAKALKRPDFILERDFAVANEYYFGNHDRVIGMVEGAPERTREMLFFYNLVRAQRGELPDHLLAFTPTELGTFYKIGPETPRQTIINMNELYWALGDMTFTERAAMMACVFAPNNRNVRMVKRLAECNLVSGDTLAAEKYLRLLDKTLAYRKWAGRVRSHGKDIYRAKMQMVNTHDTITVSDNAHFLMMQLLDANPANTVALDYILCSTLLLKDIDGFKRDYDRYCTDTGRHRPKPLYQEALCIWLAGTDAPQEEWQRYVQSPDVVQRFREYGRRRGDARFKGTYWYYFDKEKAPEI